MTVTTTTARNVKVGNDVTTSFPFDFQYGANTELVVTLVVDATGVETLQTLTTDYTTTGGGVPAATGSIEMIVAPAGAPNNETLVIERVLPFTQSVDYQRNDPFPAEVNETALDKLTFLIQQALDATARSLKLKITTTLTDVVIPDPEAGKVIVGKTTTEFENKTIAAIGALTTPVPIADGGTGASTISAARAALDVPGLADLNTFTNNQTFRVSNDGAGVNPIITFDRNSSSPADADNLAQFTFSGRNDVGETISYARIYVSILDVTDGTEDGELNWQTAVAGVTTDRMKLAEGLVVGAPTGGDKGIGTINVSAYFDDGVRVGHVAQATVVATGISAAGSTQGTATALTADNNEVTVVVAATADGVRLPTAVAGMRVSVFNRDGTDTLEVFPATGAQIDAAGANASVQLATVKHAMYVAVSTTQWYAINSA